MLRIDGTHVRRRFSSAGFTAIEMIVVVSIVIMLVAMTVPSIFPAIKKGRVHDAANAIMRASSQARQLARSHQQPAGTGTVPCYGVAIVVPNQGAAYATVIYGVLDPNSATAVTHKVATDPITNLPVGGSGGELCGDITNPTKAKPIARYEFNRNVLPYTGVTFSGTGAPTCTMMATNTSIGWFYQYRTGFVVLSGSTSDYSSPVDIGPVSPTPAPGSPAISLKSGQPAQLGVCTVDSKYIAAVAIYKIGLGNLQDL